MMGTSRSVFGGEVKAVRAYVTNFRGDGISVIDVPGGRLDGHIETGSKPHGVAMSPAGDAVFDSNEGDGTLSIIYPHTNRIQTSDPYDGGGAGPNQLAVGAVLVEATSPSFDQLSE
ncbi:hypothetical protein [Gimesia sp.]|uniref:YncE family protein n=1 Tax=Gimesia sp. TaxID=2024833 RepID=UPI0025BD09D6|nr:hypothetical protein [Gimesia sp.]